MKTQGNTILITGGGSGIGRALAHRFNDLGNTVIVAGRSEGSLKETIGDRRNMAFAILDVTDPADIRRFAGEITPRFPALNVLFNGAGIMHREDVTTARDLTDAEETITTNLLGPIRLTDALVDHLARQNDAAIVNVTSGLAFTPMAATPTYCATKAAIHSYTVSLRAKLTGKVEVIELAPPAVQTELTPGQSTREGYMPLDAYADETMTLFQQQPTPAEILVQRVHPLRWAERDGKFDAMVQMLAKY